MRQLVRSFFQAQFDQYLDWINRRGLSRIALEDARSEMMDHIDHLDSERLTNMYLPIERFKRKMDVSDEDWFNSLPGAIKELRKGRRDMLRRILEAAGDAAPVLEAGEEVLDPVPLVVCSEAWQTASKLPLGRASGNLSSRRAFAVFGLP